MGKGGFTLIDKQITGGITGGVDWLGSDFELPDDYPEDLVTFIHLDFELDTLTKVSVTKNSADFVINNDENLIGVGFRSFAITKGDVFNFTCSVTQTEFRFTLALEG